MQIQLKQSDIEQAIKNYVAAIGVNREVSEINFTMGRKTTGLLADIEVSDSENRIRPGGGLCSEIPMPTPVEKAAVTAVSVAEDVAEAQDVAEEAAANEETSTDVEEETNTEAGTTSLFGT